ncbi:succinylglutamate desuccinylase/aspartoacylase domain-containing protein [Terrimicrobium sacchariphilum]|uniref:succinylglutamate desuccinylase/aspartoacylase domain-containing protein n=1 Tax=Terrimicrobium sacchariphilum TaxID=690879 RepID=UPI00094661CF|nr:succinylglutamate desuccinylase/aspartoacylase family protein [Terrimicrobium sacchariphilum]
MKPPTTLDFLGAVTNPVSFTRDLEKLTAPLDVLAERNERLSSEHVSYLSKHGALASLPKYVFSGPGDRRSHLKVGIFAGIHGDEDSGVEAIGRLVELLGRQPEMARGYELFLYPVCNRHGYLTNSRWSEDGLDLNREFWKGSIEPEVRVLEQELEANRFDGIVALHSDDTSEGLYGFVKGHELTRYVLEPALEAAGMFLPRNFDKSIDNFEANNGIIEQGYEGILTAPPTQKFRPFEIVFETPHLADAERQVQAHLAAIAVILERFKVLISEGQNI